MNKIKNKFTGRLTIKNLNIKMLLKLYDENWEDLDQNQLWDLFVEGFDDYNSF